MKHNKYLFNSDNRLCEFAIFLSEITSTPTIIEFGPGSGRTLKGLLKAYPKSKIYGFDYRPVKLENIKVYKENLDNFSLKKFSKLIKATDIFLFLDVLEHLYAPEVFLSNIFNGSSKGSLFIISCPNFASIRMLKAWFCGEMPKNQNGYFDKSHLHWFSIYSFQIFFEHKNSSSIVCKYIFSKNKFFALLQKLYPKRLCSQFLIVAKK